MFMTTQTFPERVKEMVSKSASIRTNRTVDSPEKLFCFSKQNLDNLIDTILTTAYEELEREVGGAVNRMYEIESHKEFARGYNKAHTKALTVARGVLLGKRD